MRNSPLDCLIIAGASEAQKLTSFVQNLGYNCQQFADKQAALHHLIGHRTEISLIFYDPVSAQGDFDLTLYINLKSNIRLIPVIFMTRDESRPALEAALRHGALYCLPLPALERLGKLVITSAYEDYLRYKENTSNQINESMITLLHQGRFRFKTMHDAAMLAQQLALACPNVNLASIGMSEIFINAIEHGNLGIGYEEKSTLHDKDRWLREIQRRLALPENCHKSVLLEFTREDKFLELMVRDEGEGFDWRQYQDMDHKRLLETHGRGIIMARTLTFEHLEYSERGNEVRAVLPLAK